MTASTGMDMTISIGFIVKLCLEILSGEAVQKCSLLFECRKHKKNRCSLIVTDPTTFLIRHCFLFVTFLQLQLYKIFIFCRNFEPGVMNVSLEVENVEPQKKNGLFEEELLTGEF